MEPDQPNGVAEEVEVDQRALVNILSRYPGTFDVLRELIQNADDADARSVEVHFKTEEVAEKSQSGNPDVHNAKVRKWIIKNEGGGGFREEDWDRLGKIAAGNDNSAKVGAFGVGFYSVLSKSDRPCVRSNGKSLQFERGSDGKLRKGFGSCPADSSTTVELELRNPEPLPILADLTRFLVSSVAFLTKIETISVRLDALRVLRVEKQVQNQVDMEIPQHLKPTSPAQVLTAKSIQHAVQRITVNAEEWAFIPSTKSSSTAGDTNALVESSGRPEEEGSTNSSQPVDIKLDNSTITHDLYTATILVNLDGHPEMKRGVESSMKLPPDSFKCKAVFFNSEQHDSLARIKDSDSPKAEHFARLFFGSQGIAPENDSGRLFIGQSTNQTIGIGLHLSAHFLPTMERGSIDLANGQVKAWNKEVLGISGLLARVIYEKEMDDAKSKDDLAIAMEMGLRTMSRFAFGSTVPNGKVSQILQDAFFSCGHDPKPPLPVVSDVGISCTPNDPFRQTNKDISFLKKHPVLHDDVEAHQRSEIIRRYEIPLFKFEDIVQEFQEGVTQDAMKSFLVWWDDVHRNPPPSSSKPAREIFSKKFASKAVLIPNQGDKIVFKNIKHFTFLPLPDDLRPQDTLQVDITLGVPTKGSMECFGWKQLPLLHWLEYACSQARPPAEDLDRDSELDYRILRVLVQFALAEKLSQEQWRRVADFMKELKCVPTDNGRELPADSYFDNAAVCHDLSIAQEADFMSILPTPVAVDAGFRTRLMDMEHAKDVLSRIGVRKMMDWEVMMKGLEKEASSESNYRLLRYLVAVLRGKLTDQQTKDLKERKVFYSQAHGQVSATVLLLPGEDVRDIGLPILALPRNGLTSLQNDVDPSGTTVDLIIQALGIQKYPSLKKIIDQAASSEPEVRRPALKHLLSNLETTYKEYKAEDFTEVAFIPTKNGSLGRPDEVFESPIWEKLGLQQVPEESGRELTRLGVKMDPLPGKIIECFKNPERRPSSIDAAAELFEHLHLQASLPVSMVGEELLTIPFVPAKDPGAPSSESSAIQYFSPKDCFIESEDTKPYYRRIFPFVSFGQHGNGFLASFGTKKSPEASDMARKIPQDPQKYLDALGSMDLYLEDLRTIASQLESIPDDVKQGMKKAKMFPATKNGVIAEEILSAEKVFIRDWAGSEFISDVSIAPKEDKLEKMYLEMGSVFLGTYVRHDIFTYGHKIECRPAFNRERIILRVRCFMKKREESGRTDVSFYEEGSSNKLRVKACKSLKLKKTFAPPFGILTDQVTIEKKPIQVNAGFKFSENDESHTLWMVGCPEDSGDGGDLHHDIAVALCHALLKTYGLNDVLLLASFFTMTDESLMEYYDEKMPEPSNASDSKAKSSNKVEELVKLIQKKLARLGQDITRPANQDDQDRDDLERAMDSWGGLNPDADFTASSQPHPVSPKNQIRKCKQVHAVLLREKEDLPTTDIKFLVARSTKGPLPEDLKEMVDEFAGIVSRLAGVFGLNASTSCYLFWKDGDEHLMAFHRDKFIYLNLAHYYESVYINRVEKEEVITEWYLMMAHEIAHNVSKDHDEYHGSLSSRLAVTHFPAFMTYRDELSAGV